MKEKVSIIIPVRNEEKYVSKCIDSILQQNYNIDLFDIILVDGMSTDSTRSIVENYQKRYSNIILLTNEKKITPISLNIGIKYSNSDIVIILGSHSYIHKDFIKNNVRNLKNREIDCSGGIVKFVSDTAVAESIGLATSCKFGAGNAMFRYASTESFVDTVPFAAYRKDIFEKLGYFDEELIRNQDDEFNYRITKSGGKILLSPDIISFYYSRSSLQKLWKQYKQYGFWKVRVIQKYKKPASIRHLVPFIFVSTLLITLIGAIVSKIFLKMFMFVLCLYLTCDVIISLCLSLKNNIKYLPFLLITFPILHIGYGYGFLKGIINFYILRRKK